MPNPPPRRSSAGWSLSRLTAGRCAGTIDGIGPSLRWGDGNLDSRRGAATSDAAGGVRAAQTKRAGGFPPAP